MLAKIIKKFFPIIAKYRVKTFKHSGNLGDIIYSLPTIIALGGGKLFISKDTPSPGIPMTDEMVIQLIELLKTQPYLVDVRPFHGEKMDYDLDKFREQDMANILLSLCHLRAFGVNFDLSKPWLENITQIHVAEIVINRTLRYHGDNINWHILEGYENRCVFIGFEEEYSAFKRETGLDIAGYETESILEFARIIRGSSLFIGNQSLGYALAEAMKYPRVLEVCPYATNCMPQSPNGHMELTKEIIEGYLNR